MSGNLSASERVAAAMLFYFQAGLDAHAAIKDGARAVSVPSPSLEDLERVIEQTPIARWKSVLPVAEALIDDAVKNAERDPVDVGRDVLNVVRRGQKIVEKLTGGGPKDIRDLASQVAKARGGK